MRLGEGLMFLRLALLVNEPIVEKGLCPLPPQPMMHLVLAKSVFPKGVKVGGDGKK